MKGCSEAVFTHPLGGANTSVCEPSAARKESRRYELWPKPPTSSTALTLRFVDEICPLTREMISRSTGANMFTMSLPWSVNLPLRTPWAASSTSPGTTCCWENIENAWGQTYQES